MIEARYVLNHYSSTDLGTLGGPASVDALAHFGLGVALCDQGDLAGAIAAWHKATDLAACGSLSSPLIVLDISAQESGVHVKDRSRQRPVLAAPSPQPQTVGPQAPL